MVLRAERAIRREEAPQPLSCDAFRSAADTEGE
jgi:hypothetical protein